MSYKIGQRIKVINDSNIPLRNCATTIRNIVTGRTGTRYLCATESGKTGWLLEAWFFDPSKPKPRKLIPLVLLAETEGIKYSTLAHAFRAGKLKAEKVDGSLSSTYDDIREWKNVFARQPVDK